MTKHIQINDWNNLSPNKQEQIQDWITQILNAKLAAQNLLEFLSQVNSVSDDSIPEFLKALKNTVDIDFEVADTALEEALSRGDLQASRVNLDAAASPRNPEDFCEIVCTMVCGQDGNCYRECRRICQ